MENQEQPFNDKVYSLQWLYVLLCMRMCMYLGWILLVEEGLWLD